MSLWVTFLSWLTFLCSRRYKYSSEHQSLHPTDLQRAQLADRGFGILRRMEAFFEAQAQHLPSAKDLRDLANAEPGSSALWNIPLMFPSEILDRGGTCSKSILDIEWRLRYAACHDALEMLRKHLLTRTGLISYKMKYLHGQYDGTRSSQTISSISDKIAGCAARYRASSSMIRKYSQRVGRIAPELLELHDGDIRGIDREAMDDTREMSVSLSWIWSASGIDAGDDKAMHDSKWHLGLRQSDCLLTGFQGLRVAWCKASARAHRWQEECLLLQEEMRRVPETLRQQAEEWESRGRNQQGLTDLTHAMIEGRIAYAARQASLRRALAQFCESKWASVSLRLATGLGGIALNESQYELA